MQPADLIFVPRLQTLRIRNDGDVWAAAEVVSAAVALAARVHERRLGRQLIEPSSVGPFLGEVRVLRGLLHLNGFEPPRWTVEAGEAAVSAGSH